MSSSSSLKQKIRKEMTRNNAVIIAVLPLAIAAVIVVFRLVSPENVGYYTDVYTVALFFVMALLAVGGGATAVRRR